MEQGRFDACMLRLQRGEKDALKEIYEAYLTYVFSVIYQVVGNHDDAEDVTAEFFIKLWTNADRYVPGSSHKAYIATIARNMAIDYLRKHKKEVLIAEFTTDSSEDDSATRTESVIISDKETGSSVEEEVVSCLSLKEALDKLKPKEREIINLKIMGDMTFKEISEATGTPMGTVTWLYREAIKKLRRCGYE